MKRGIADVGYAAWSNPSAKPKALAFGTAVVSPSPLAGRGKDCPDAALLREQLTISRLGQLRFYSPRL